MNDLTVGDGFKFGCGFMLAAVVAQIGVVIAILIISAIFGGALGVLLDGLASIVRLF
jgi:hypothetical protein